MHKFLGRSGGLGRRWLPTGGLLLLCALWAARWVRGDLVPGTASGVGFRLRPLCTDAAILAAFAVLAGVGALLRRQSWTRGRVLGAVLVGLGLFVLPSVVVGFAGEWVDDATRVAMFSLTPLFAAVLEPHLSRDGAERGEARGQFPASMIAFAGSLLVFPVEVPRSYLSSLALVGLVMAAAIVAAANCLAVKIVREDGHIFVLAAGSSASAACLLVALGLVFRGNDQLGSSIGLWSLPNLIALAMLFWLMGRMSAILMTTRFLIAPFLANLISLILLRPQVHLQGWLGLMLIAVGSGWILLANRGAGEPSRRLLDIR